PNSANTPSSAWPNAGDRLESIIRGQARLLSAPCECEAPILWSPRRADEGSLEAIRSALMRYRVSLALLLCITGVLAACQSLGIDSSARRLERLIQAGRWVEARPLAEALYAAADANDQHAIFQVGLQLAQIRRRIGDSRADVAERTVEAAEKLF